MKEFVLILKEYKYLSSEKMFPQLQFKALLVKSEVG